MPNIPLDPAFVNTIDINRLINEVKKRPILYDNKHVSYSDRVEKVKAWYEVSAAVVDDWEHMGDEERDTTERQVRGKWRHIRDYFVKDIKAQKGGSKNKKRKSYAYSKKLTFLLPVIRVRNPNGSYSRPSTSNKHNLGDHCKVEEVIYDENSAEAYDIEDSEMDHDGNSSEAIHSVDPLCEATLEMFDDPTPPPPPPPPPPPQQPPAAVSMPEPRDKPGPSSSSSSSSQVAKKDDDTEDFDRMFLLSLLPALRQVPESMKLQVKIEMQQALAAGMRGNSGGRMPY